MAIAIDSEHCWPVTDFTTFLSVKEVERLRSVDSRKDSAGLSSFKSQEILHLDEDVRFEKHGIKGRALLCWCSNRRAVSVSVRFDDGHQKDDAYLVSRTKDEISKWQLKSHFSDTIKICQFLLDTILRIKSRPSGVVAFFGETNSRKSTFARGLIDLYLQTLQHGPRRPHLLTFEDPIETSFDGSQSDFKSEDVVESLRKAANRLCVDYTSRTIGFDTPSLRAGLLNALRQKPSVVYVGETRTRNDWREVLKFGGTGHLIVTTAHGSTLQESMSQLLQAMGASTPAERSFVAGNVLGVVHLRPYSSERRKPDGSIDTRIDVIPTMWRRTPSGANTLVTDGLGSILPHNPGPKFDNSISSFGRHWFGCFLNGPDASGAPAANSIDPKVLHQLLLDDLQGL